MQVPAGWDAGTVSRQFGAYVFVDVHKCGKTVISFGGGSPILTSEVFRLDGLAPKEAEEIGFAAQHFIECVAKARKP
jgi:hypothetical protein